MPGKSYFSRTFFNLSGIPKQDEILMNPASFKSRLQSGVYIRSINSIISQPMKEIKFSKTRKVKSPTRGHSTDAGIDFYIPDDMIWEHFTLYQGNHLLIDSGIQMNIPEGHMLVCLEKSGIARQGAIIGARVVDSGYTGNIHIHVMCISKEPFTMKSGQKIAQFVLVPILLPIPKEVPLDLLFPDFEDKGSRGKGGF